MQELHGFPWKKAQYSLSSIAGPQMAESSLSPPLLSPSASEESMTDFGPITPLQSLNNIELQIASDTHTEEEHEMQHTSIKQTSCSRNDYQEQDNLKPPPFPRRASHDLFECIEQTPNKRLSEHQACYVFSQVVEAAYYLDSQGITHRDIKDENLVIDKDLKVMVFTCSETMF